MKTTLLITVLFFLVQMLFSQVLSEWRNIGRTGIYKETGLLNKWPEDGLQLIWSIEDLPPGYSSVSFADSTIFSTGVVDEMDVLIAIDLNGNIKWKTPYGRAWDKSYTYSRCTPTVEKESVYVSSGLGDVACINIITGEINWKKNAHEKFEGTYGVWGISESVLIVDDKLIYTLGGEKTTIVALNKKTGETLWKSESLNDSPAYLSPILVETAKKKIIITVLSSYLIIVDAKNGKILDKFNYATLDNEECLAVWEGSPYININTPIYKDGYLYMTSGYNHIGARFKISDDFMISVDWIDHTLDVHHGGVVLVDGYIYGANWLDNRSGNWCCIDWETGKTMYEQEWFNKGSIIYNDGMLYCYEEKTGNIALVEANPSEFKIVSSFKVPLGSGPHWSHLVIKDGILYVRHVDAVMAYDIKDK